LPEEVADATHRYLDSLTPRQRSDLSGIRDRLAVLAESDVGKWLDPEVTAGQRIQLLDAIRGGAVVYFGLDADRRPLLTQMLGAAIVQDLLTAVAALQRRPRPAIVLIDEFSALGSREVVRLFGRARSAGLSLLLGTQELADLRPPGGERLLDQVMGNLSLLVAHRQVVPASAELVAALAGSRGAWRVTRHSDGRSTRTRTRERLLECDRVMRLPQGWGAVLELADGSGARIVHVQAPSIYETGEVAQ
jgi:type IV secretory pathway TraG/TraD family ATPase VirD4